MRRSSCWLPVLRSLSLLPLESSFEGQGQPLEAGRPPRKEPPAFLISRSAAATAGTVLPSATSVSSNPQARTLSPARKRRAPMGLGRAQTQREARARVILHSYRHLMSGLGKAPPPAELSRSSTAQRLGYGLRGSEREERGQGGRSEEGAERSGRGKASRLSTQMVGPPGLVHRRRSKTKYGFGPRSRGPQLNAGGHPGPPRRAHGAAPASPLTRGRPAGRFPAAQAANSQCNSSPGLSSGCG